MAVLASGCGSLAKLAVAGGECIGGSCYPAWNEEFNEGISEGIRFAG